MLNFLNITLKPLSVLILALLLFCMSSKILFANEIDLKILEKYKFTQVVVRLNNGDVFSCEILNYELEDGKVNKVEVATAIGKTKIFADEIAEIVHYQDYNRHSHRIYILPTAEPISGNHFVGNFEILFFYVGFGISDYFSITAGRSVIPTIRSQEQFSVVNAKATLYQQYWDSMEGNMSIALGYNHALVNSDNTVSHLYSAISFRGAKSILTASVFAKIGSKDFYEARFGENFLPFSFENGSIGFAIGLDTRFSSTRDIHFIGELWNSNITKPGSSGLLLGFRIGNTKIAADFGLAVFGSPYFVPFTGFVWTPF